MQTRRVLFAILGLFLFAAACGGDDDDAAVDTSAGDDAAADVADDDMADDEMADDDMAEDEPAASDCAPTSGTFESLDGAVSVSPVSAVAGTVFDGQAYNIYLSDRELSTDELGIISIPAVEGDEVIITVGINTFNAEEPVEPVVAGEVVEYTGDFGVRTFFVTADLGAGGFLGEADNTIASGTLTVSSVSATSICGDITYTDGEKTITAVFDAPVVPT